MQLEFTIQIVENGYVVTVKCYNKQLMVHVAATPEEVGAIVKEQIEKKKGESR